jgi:hypothetical protein
VVLAVEVLLAATGSGVVAVTVAVFESEPACAGAVTVDGDVRRRGPGARAGRVQVTETLPELEQVQPVPVADTKVTPPAGCRPREPGRVSRSGVGHRQRVRDRTVRVDRGRPVLVIERSAHSAPPETPGMEAA